MLILGLVGPPRTIFSLGCCIATCDGNASDAVLGRSVGFFGDARPRHLQTFRTLAGIALALAATSVRWLVMLLVVLGGHKARRRALGSFGGSSRALPRVPGFGSLAHPCGQLDLPCIHGVQSVDKPFSFVHPYKRLV